MATQMTKQPPTGVDNKGGYKRPKNAPRSLFDQAIVKRAIMDAFSKLDPRLVARNPVMFVVKVGSVMTTFFFLRDVFTHAPDLLFTGQITAWLWFTLLFANFAEAMAEGRGKAQAEALRKAKTETMARKLVEGTSDERVHGLRPVVRVPGTELRKGDLVICEVGEMIPGDGEVIEGIASVDESAITGESAPVIRESGGDRSAVTGGTKVLSDQIVIRITSNPGETFIDRMIALVEGAHRQKTPNEIALTILLCGMTIIFVLAVVTLVPFAAYSVRAARLGGCQPSPCWLL